MIVTMIICHGPHYHHHHNNYFRRHHHPDYHSNNISRLAIEKRRHSMMCHDRLCDEDAIEKRDAPFDSRPLSMAGAVKARYCLCHL